MSPDLLPLPNLPNITPIRCEKCGQSAHLLAQHPDAYSRGRSELWAYQCAACGHKMYREADI
jgi:hypothetical protein